MTKSKKPEKKNCKMYMAIQIQTDDKGANWLIQKYGSQADMSQWHVIQIQKPQVYTNQQFQSSMIQ